ncbi:MAG: Rieske 2Fe-2S domain-containing protein, partial [Pseudomonadota bacterium]|nr:Rieske 2Fe-2S domain-containing protein [Pseudomonadota bacterium]
MGKLEQITPVDYAKLIEPDRVHGSLYTDPAVFEQELDRIFHRGWTFVGHASEIPNPGDYITRDIGREPVIMIRGKDNQVRVLMNRCQHRGNLLCNREKGNQKNFTCPYHGWAYGIDGALLDVPYAGGFNKEMGKFNLEQPRTDSYRGFVFINISGDAESFDAYLGKGRMLIDRACDLSPEGEIELSAGWVRHRYFANWKMLPENDTDGYHVNFTHQSFVRAIDSQYNEFVTDEKDVKGVIKDWGGGHTEIDFEAGYP